MGYNALNEGLRASRGFCEADLGRIQDSYPPGNRSLKRLIQRILFLSALCNFLG